MEQAQEKTPRKREYYRIIDGRRYDNALLEQADTYISNASGNKISEPEARALGEAMHDARRVTAIEKQTLEYIRSNYPMSEKAAKWWDENIKITENLAQRIFDVKKRQGVPGLTVEYDQAERILQTNFPNNQIVFEEAFARALEAFLTDESSFETPYNLVHEIFTDMSAETASRQESVKEKLIGFFNTGKIALLPVYDPENPDSWDQLPYNIPEGRETVEDNWIFVLSLPDLSDHIYWAIVDRSGDKAAFAYGFN